MAGFSLNSPIWRWIENFYTYPAPPPRVRDPNKPMQVICVGFPRNGTESLQNALMILGYDYTYHGWDIVFEEPLRCRQWVELAKKKWHSQTGDCKITAVEFDALIGHSVAVTDAAGSCFAEDLIREYPDAKIVLNMRRDTQAWYRSAIKNLCVTGNDRLFIWTLTWFSKDLFWMWHCYQRFLWLRLFRSTDLTLRSGVEKQGIWVQREHANMIRGLMHSRGEDDRLLEWYLEDGWEPLCKFLGKEVPKDTPFPRTNDAAGYSGRVDAILKKRAMGAFKNMALVAAGLAAVIGSIVWFIRRAR